MTMTTSSFQQQAEGVALLGQYVRHALETKARSGDPTTYNEIISRASAISGAGDQAELKVLIQVLANNVSFIDERVHTKLLTKLMGANLWTAPVEIATALCDFSLNLVSANTGCVHGVVDMLVRNFTPPIGFTPPDPTETEAHAEYEARKRGVQQVCVESLKRVLQLVPTAATVLLSHILHRLPHKRLEAHFHVAFLESALALASSEEGKPLRDDILLGIVDRLLQVDMDLRWEDIQALEEAEEEEEEEEDVALGGGHPGKRGHRDDDDDDDEDVFELEELTQQVDKTAAAVLKERGPVDATADKLDSMMVLTLQHLTQRTSTVTELYAAFSTLMRAFNTSLLHAYKSKFTQFLVFYGCARDSTQQASKQLCDALVQRVGDPTTAVITRSAACAYLASFLARSAFLHPSFVTAQLTRLGDIATAMLDTVDRRISAMAETQSTSGGGAAGAASSTEAEVLCAVCQGCLYVLCYRLRQFVGPNTPPSVALRSLPLTRLLFHATDPLARCLPSVVTEFLHHAPSAGLIQEEQAAALLRRHRSQQGGEEGAWSGGGGGGGALPGGRAPGGGGARVQLDSFFPFDPYLLRRSARLLSLSKTYIRWGDACTLGGDGDDGEDEDEDEDDEEEEEEEDEDEEDGESQRMPGSCSAGTTPASAAELEAIANMANGGGLGWGGPAQGPAAAFVSPVRPFFGAGTASNSPGGGKGAWSGSSFGSTPTSDRLLGSTPMGTTPMGASYLGTTPRGASPMSLGKSYSEVLMFGGRQ